MDNPIDIIETPKFVEDAKQCLTESQLKAIRQLLASEPYVGEPVKSQPEILCLHWSPKLNILYLVASDVSEVFLLTITKNSLGEPKK